MSIEFRDRRRLYTGDTSRAQPKADDALLGRGSRTENFCELQDKPKENRRGIVTDFWQGSSQENLHGFVYPPWRENKTYQETFQRENPHPSHRVYNRAVEISRTTGEIRAS